MFDLFEDIGHKIKILALVLAIGGIAGSVILGFSIMSKDSSGSLLDINYIGIGLVVMIIGSLISWLGAFGLYGFGQLIENSDRMLYKMEAIIKQCSSANSTSSSPSSTSSQRSPCPKKISAKDSPPPSQGPSQAQLDALNNLYLQGLITYAEFQKKMDEFNQ